MSIVTANAKTNTADIHVRIDAETKREAESVLEKLGVSPSDAISMFYKQVTIRKEIPFRISLRNRRTPDFEDMDKTQIMKELAKGEADYAAGRVYSIEEVMAKME